MNTRRVAGRVGLMFLVVSSMGALPVGSCAKACGKAGGRSAARGASRSGELARLGAHGAGHSADDLARLGVRGGRHSADDLARLGGRSRGLGPVPLPLSSGGHVADDLAHLSAARLDEAVTALPDVEGATSRLAGVASPRGARVAERGVGPGFGRDYVRSVDRLKVTRRQHQQLLDALDLAQSAAEEVIGQLADAALDDGGSYDEDDDEVDPGERPAPSPAVAAGARLRLQAAGRVLDHELEAILDPEQRARFHELLGSSEVIAYRLGRERPIVVVGPGRRVAPRPD